MMLRMFSAYPLLILVVPFWDSGTARDLHVAERLPDGLEHLNISSNPKPQFE